MRSFGAAGPEMVGQEKSDVGKYDIAQSDSVKIVRIRLPLTFPAARLKVTKKNKGSNDYDIRSRRVACCDGLLNTVSVFV